MENQNQQEPGPKLNTNDSKGYDRRQSSDPNQPYFGKLDNPAEQSNTKKSLNQGSDQGNNEEEQEQPPILTDADWADSETLYNKSMALFKYDERNPQICEHYRYTNPDFERDGML